jgi:hypothetical protein
LLSNVEPITLACAGPLVIGTATFSVQCSKHAPTMNEPVVENVLTPHALVAVTRQKYWVAMSRSKPSVKLVVASVVSTTILLNPASAAICRW